MLSIFSSPATKTYLERELAEAVQEEEEETVEMVATQEPGSDSDSDDGEGPYPFALQQPSAQSITNSLEASLWSLDVSSTSASSSMEMSDSEVMGWMDMRVFMFVKKKLIVTHL